MVYCYHGRLCIMCVSLPTGKRVVPGWRVLLVVVTAKLWYVVVGDAHRSTVALCVAAALVVRLLDDGNAEDVLDRTLNTGLRVSALPGRTQEKNTMHRLSRR